MKHILLVDDDQDMIMLIERWLKKEYRVATAISGKDAIEYITKEKPDLVLLDYYMPDMNGPETLKEIRKIQGCTELPVVFLTGMEEVEGDATDIEPSAFWSKSMGKKQLLPAIAELLESIS